MMLKIKKKFLGIKINPLDLKVKLTDLFKSSKSADTQTLQMLRKTS